MTPTRVLVVDDSAFMRRTLRMILETDPELQVVDVARNGEEAVEKARALKPDVITLDLSMLGEDSSASVHVSDLHQGVCATAQTVDAVDREGPRSVAFGTDYERFWYRGNTVLACLPVSGGVVAVKVAVTGDAQADEPEILALTQAIADAFVRGDCAGARRARPRRPRRRSTRPRSPRARPRATAASRAIWR